LKAVKSCIIVLLILTGFSVKAQYIQFSQYYASPTVLAPSFAGAVEKSRVSFNYRDQWAKIPNSIFLTYSAAYDINVPDISSGFGVLAIRDEAGAGNLGRTEIGVLYSWYGLLNKQSGLYFRPGVQFKMSQRSIDFEKLIFGDQLVNWEPGQELQATTQPYPENVKRTYVDATASGMLYNKEFWAGFSADHLFRPNDAFYADDYRIPIKYSVFGGYRFELANSKYGHRSANKIKDWFFISAYYRLQGKSDQFDIGGYWDHTPFTIGVWVRGLPYMNIMNTLNIDAVILMVGYKISNFTVGYSYDLTVSPLLSQTGGSHEFSISYKFQTDLKSKKRDGPMPCPSL